MIFGESFCEGERSLDIRRAERLPDRIDDGIFQLLPLVRREEHIDEAFFELFNLASQPSDVEHERERKHNRDHLEDTRQRRGLVRGNHHSSIRAKIGF